METYPFGIRLRRISLVASVVLIAFNAALGIWSNVALEVALVVVNLARLLRTEDDLDDDLDEISVGDTGFEPVTSSV